MAPETAAVLGNKLRLLNSYYSNLIEGHKTTIPDIESALQNRFEEDMLADFCEYFLGVCRDQIGFMEKLLRNTPLPWADEPGHLRNDRDKQLGLR